ncbi:uncharacterized protein [Atheta coriaria]|uniref:uncharacterized protein n=1 Tax=Dalotia coriaria TaxID=877792 RepID=UPI0031F3C490
MNQTIRQPRPKMTRGSRPGTANSNHDQQQINNNSKMTHPNQQLPQVVSTIPVMDNVVMLDNSVLMQPNQPQYINLERSVVRPVSAARNPQKNVKILQDIAIRPSNSAGTSQSQQSQEVVPVNRRPQSMQLTMNTNTNPMYVATQPIPKPVRRMPAEMLPPGGKFVYFKNVGGPPPGTSTSQVSILHDTQQHRPPSASPSVGSAVSVVPVVQPGNVVMKPMRDYPEYKMTIHGFTNAHKNIMFRMNHFIGSLFHPLIESNVYIMTLSVNYGQLVCFQIERKILGDFVCRLIPRMLETSTLPTVVELKDAPSNWSDGMRLNVVIGQSNYELVAKNMARSFQSRKTALHEYEQLPDYLNAQFTIRRNFMSIKFTTGKQHAKSKFLELIRRITAAAKKGMETVPSKVDHDTQTDGGGMVPYGLCGQHEQQLDMINTSQTKQKYRDMIQHEQVKTLEMKYKYQQEALANIDMQVQELMEQYRRREFRKNKLDSMFSYVRLKEAQTDTMWGLVGYDRFITLPLGHRTTMKFLDAVKAIIEFSAKHFRIIRGNIQKLEEEIRKDQENKSKKRSYIRSSHRESGSKKKEEKAEKRILRDCNRDDKSEKIKSREKPSPPSLSSSIGGCYSSTIRKPVDIPSMADYFSGFKQILSEFKLVQGEMNMAANIGDDMGMGLY